MILYNPSHFHFSYSSPIMGRFLKRKCHFCKQDLRKVPKDTIVMGEIELGFDEPPCIQRYYWCSKDCALEWYNQRKTLAKSYEDNELGLNNFIKGGEK